MSEPTTNPRVTRSQRRMFYNFTRRYGEAITLNKVDTNSMDYETGDRTRTYTTLNIRNAVYVPETQTRSVVYTPSMMQAVRQYAWQGGAGQDMEETMFLIYERDMRSWGEVDQTQFVVHRSVSYEVTGSQRFDGGVVINCKAARGSR